MFGRIAKFFYESHLFGSLLAPFRRPSAHYAAARALATIALARDVPSTRRSGKHSRPGPLMPAGHKLFRATLRAARRRKVRVPQRKPVGAGVVAFGGRGY